MNTLTATIEFSFKGKIITLSTELDLDDILSKHQHLPSLHTLLATQHRIDSYSYEYEMLLGEDIIFSNPKGWVTEFVDNLHFDQQGFEQRWHQYQTLEQLAPLIKQQLDINDIHQYQALKTVLLAAYASGKAES